MKLSKEPAFPLSAGQLKEHQNGYFYDVGLTKLEYASIEAMKGLLSVPNNAEFDIVCTQAIQCAKKLIKQLEKEQL